MNIQNIIDETTRGIYSVEDKLSIATIFIFCYQKDAMLFARLLYTNDYNGFIEDLELKYKDWNINFKINFGNDLIKRCFNRTLGEVRRVEDKNGYYKALYDCDEYAVAIYNIVNKVEDYK